ncbi:MAG: NADP-dependent isocitrate dehydrogenase [Deltaproteobacteria bacterium]|nr:NADP-dependent isocitrate dehydrogenase [Deltaproteobacteria bacterium]
MTARIIWTKIDEAPALATYSLLPIVQAYLKGTGIEVETSDISLAGRIIANFPEKLSDDQKVADHLTELGELAKTPAANIIKLPNISASIPQLQDAIKELQEKGYDIPDYPEEPKTDEEKALQKRFAACLGSAVNPVLREGNSDRRAATSVKKFAQKHPHRMMKPWPESGSKARVAHMDDKDFYASEKSITMKAAGEVRIEFVGDGETKVLKESLKLQEGEVVDSSVMNVAALRKFYAEQIEEAKKDGVLLSLHLKATMMKISDPIMFGHAVSVYYAAALDKHAAALKEIGANVNNGLQDVLDKLDRLPADKKAEIEADIAAVYETQPALAMVDSRKGITNLHVPNNIIVDASMPNVVRDGGKMWNNDDELQDCIAMVPDRCYATMYAEILEDAKAKGQFDPSTMGSVSNVGLMAQKAEEYGSHDKTFEAPASGKINVVDAASGEVLLEQVVEKGDIFRACQAKDEPIRDWVKLAVTRARASGEPAIFWLDANRGHDAQIIEKVKKYLPEHDTAGLTIEIMDPRAAMKFSLERVRKGENTIAVTGNVLRDYLTDLFPILELGTSARMLSIVPLLQGGGLFETGAGGSAPKHVQQFLKEGHLRWDSLGEYCALVPSLEQAAKFSGNETANLMAKTLDTAIGTYLENARYPSRKVNEIDNRGSTFFLALYWAQALAAQDEDPKLKARFKEVAEELGKHEEAIAQEMIDCQGEAVDVGGYYLFDDAKTEKAMRPSETFNKVIDAL